MAPDPDNVRVAVIVQALRGRPATTQALAAATGMRPDDVAAALSALHETGALYLRDGSVIAAYPLSFVPTAHRVTVGGETIYANCAVDALAVPPMVDELSEIASVCGHCGTAITVAMRGERVLRFEPAAPVVFYPERECCAPGPSVLTRCPHIQFFCGREHALRWQEDHPELRGAVLDLAAAAAFSREHFAATIGAVRQLAGFDDTVAGESAGRRSAGGSVVRRPT
jgi:alkylmercury lyase